MTLEQNRDPYAPPPRHRDHSGRFVRLVLVAALLGAAVWGFTQYESPGDGLVAEAPAEAPQRLAESSLDAAGANPEPPPPDGTSGAPPAGK